LELQQDVKENTENKDMDMCSLLNHNVNTDNMGQLKKHQA